MEDDEKIRKRKVAVVAAAHAAAANAIATAYLALNIPFKPRTDRNDERRKYMNSILENDDKCRHNLRMGVQSFHHLCFLINAQEVVIGNDNCSLEEMVMRFLHMIGHNVRHRVLEDRFYRSRETISRQFNEILKCVLKLYKPLIADHLAVVHGSGTPPEIGSDPRFSEYFKGCLGALDGTHITASVPVEEQDRFRGRKLITTQNVLAACSFDLKFTYVLPGWEGTAHDQRVLDDALARANPFVVPSGRYYLVDGGYTNQPGFLSPYRRTLYHVSEHEGRTPQNEKELFNQRHSLLRNSIERAFGVLKKRWPMLSTQSFYPYKTQVKIVLACFILHNLIRGVEPYDPILDEVDKELSGAPIDESVDDAPPMSHSVQKARWVEFRDGIARKMFDDFKNRRNVY